MAVDRLLASVVAALFVLRAVAAHGACKVDADDQKGDEICALQLPLAHRLHHAVPEAIKESFAHLAAGEHLFKAMDAFPQVCAQAQQNASAAVEQKMICRSQRARVPSIYSGLLNKPSSYAAMTEHEKTKFEHDIATSLMTSTVVTETSAEFGKRLFALVVAGGKQFNGLDEGDALVAAFGPKCSVHNTGFAGLKPADIKDILTVDGNVREIWCLMYCLSKNVAWLDKILSKADESFLVSTFGPSAGTAAWRVVQERRILIEATMLLPPNERYTFGTPDYMFPAPGGWVDFTFGANLPARLGGGQLWRGARAYVGCKEVNFTTDDQSIVPPLSSREITAECEGKTPPCKLRWMPGLSCYSIPQDTIFWNHTRHNGYRVASGPSGTTANALQLALSLGFSQSDMLAFRTVMMAWLVTSDDHSFIEVMLAAQPYTVEPSLAMQWGQGLTDLCEHADFKQIWPQKYLLKTSWGPEFRRPEHFSP